MTLLVKTLAAVAAGTVLAPFRREKHMFVPRL